MKITIDIPERTRCITICLVYEDGSGNMAMAATMKGTLEIEDGATFYIPKARAEEE